MSDEFSVIEKFFKKNFQRDDVVLGSGDDCAVVALPPGKQLLTTTDTLNQDIHFFKNTSPEDIGYKSIAVSLSDIAAMGGEPRWALLSLTIPMLDESWLALFAKGVFACLEEFNVQLVGGNLSRGPLSITSQLLGSVDQGKYLTRNNASPNDLIYVTGTLGDGGLALALLQNEQSNELFTDEQKIIQRLWRPIPRIKEGQILATIASAAIDISDSLALDLQHILAQSKVGATLFLDSLPLSNTLQKLPTEQAKLLALTSGDDYELCFTLSPEKVSLLQKIDCPLTCIGKIEVAQGLRVIESNGTQLHLDPNLIGYKHW